MLASLLGILSPAAAAEPIATHVHAVIRGRFAEVRIEQEWEGVPPARATSFEIPHDAVIQSVWRTCDGQRGLNEATLTANKPGLAVLTLSGERFGCRRSTVSWGYVEPLETREFVVQGDAAFAPTGSLSVKVDLQLPDVWNASSGTHTIATTQEDGTTTLSCIDCRAEERRDIHFAWDRPLRRVEPLISDSRLDLTIRPDILRDLPRAEPLDPVIVVDTTGSMTATKQQLDEVIAALREGFGSPIPVAYGEDVAGLADGCRSKEVPCAVVLLSDGRFGAPLPYDALPSSVHVFTIGVGDRISRGPLSELAALGGGSTTTLRPNEPPQRAADWALERLTHSTLTDVTVAFGSDTPEKVPNHWSGDPIRAQKNWETHPPTQARVAGKVGELEVAFEVAIDTTKHMRHRSIDAVAQGNPSKLFGAWTLPRCQVPLGQPPTEACTGSPGTADGGWDGQVRLDPVVMLRAVRTVHQPAHTLRTMQRNTGSLQYCYEKELKGDPRLEGSLRTTMVLTQGKVSGVVVMENSLTPELGKCIVQKLARWRFDRSISSPSVEGDFSFHPSGLP